MAAEVSADLNVINDEDMLRRMWQQTDDFGRKKEIRQRMYKLREQRLKDFYTGDQESITSMASRKHAAPTHADSISDQGFMAMKSKEIRDSESPTRDIHRRQGDNNYWNSVQQSSYSTHGDDGNLRQSYDRSSTGTGHSEDGKTQIRLEADERGFTSSKTTESDNSKTVSDQQQHDAHIATASHTKTDDGEAYSFSTSKEHQESKSSVVKSKDSSSTFTSSSTKWESSSSSSSKEVSSSSRFGRITADTDLKALTSGDDVDFISKNFNKDHEFNHSTTHKARDISQDNRTFQTSDVRYYTDLDATSKSFIDNELRNNIKNSLKDVTVDIKEDHFGNQDLRRDSATSYTTELTTEVGGVNSSVGNETTKVSREIITELDKSNVVDQNIMTEIHKLDSFLSTQNTTGTNTPASPRSVMGDVNWTVVSNKEGEFVVKKENAPLSPGSRATAIKQPDNLDLPKECTEGQYVTTYNEHYTNKKISMDVSPTHDAFARSLRQTPPGTPRSLSRQSLDRSSPERKTKSSPRSSPDKERKSSTSSYTIDKSNGRRKTSSDVTRQTSTSKDSTLKSKRKFSTTQTKAAAKARASTPGTSPSTSPQRKQKERSESPTSSASDSDASQRTYDKKSTTSIHKRADVVRKNLMDSFDKESQNSDFEKTPTKSSSRPSSPEKSPIRKMSNASDNKTTGILRKDSRTNSTLINESSLRTNENKMPTVVAPYLRDKSPEYSSEGSISREIKHSQRVLSSPDSSPERAAFTPIKQFRTNPEMTSDTIQVTTTETDKDKSKHLSEAFITKESANENCNFDLLKVDVTTLKSSSKTASSPTKEVSKPSTSPLQNGSKVRSVSPEKARSPSPTKTHKPVSTITRTESTTRRSSIQLKNTPEKETNERSKSPTKSPTSRKPSLRQGSQSPEKETISKGSPSEPLHHARKASVPIETQSPTRREKSRSPSPIKRGISNTAKGSVVSTTTVIKKEFSYDSAPNTRHSNRTPSPTKSSSEKSRTPSPKKDNLEAKSPSPQRDKYKKSKQQLSSPSVSPCSSPERPSDRNIDKSKPIRKTSGPKTPDKETIRTTRRSSIPRADQSTLTRKTVQTTIEIRSKPSNKISTPIAKTKPTQNSVFKNTRTDSQNSIDRQTTTKSYSTTIKKRMEETKEPHKTTAPNKRTVTTTAVIALQKPTVASQVRQTSTSTVSKAITYNRASSKEIIPKRIGTPTDTNQSKTTTTKRTAIRTITPKSKPTINVDIDETYKCEKSTHSDTILTKRIQSKELSSTDENTVHGFKGETINIEIEDNSLENETPPELFPDTEDEDIPEKQEYNKPEENITHIQEKTILPDSKRKGTSQFMVTIKKPTQSSTVPSKTSVRTVTGRSSSGPLRGTSQTPIKTTQTKIASNITNKRQITSSVQKADSLSSIKSNDKNRPDNTPQRRQMSKPEMSLTKPSHPTSKSTIKNQVAETGIASRNVTSAKSVTVKRLVSGNKKSSVSMTPSSTEDEDDCIPSVVTPNRQEQEYIEELEQMRRAEEQDYASKLVATSNHENQLLNVIVQHPKSSRESSPDYSNRPQAFCTVSDDGGAIPRYADMISEPEDVEVFDVKVKPEIETHYKKQPIQVTDLDEESEGEGKLNVSVADRVTHFLETSKAHSETHVREEPESGYQAPNEGTKSVLKAKAMFETIAKNQLAPPAPGNKPVDILARPSVFEARRGQITPKPIPSEIDMNNLVQETETVEIEFKKDSETIKENKYDEPLMDINNTMKQQAKTPSPIIEASFPVDTLVEKEKLNNNQTLLSRNEATVSSKTPQKTPKSDLTTKNMRKEPTPSFDKKLVTSNKPKPIEKSISVAAEVSSKKAFFERKSHDHNTPTKQTKPLTSSKERKPLTESIQNKENIRGPSPPRKTSQTSTFIEKEKSFSRTSPERKVSIETPAKERKHSVKSESPERKISLSKSVKERKSSFTKEDITSAQVVTLQKKESFSKVTPERKTSPSRVSPERRAPITLRTFPDHKSNSEPVKEAPLKNMPSSPIKERKPSFTRESPERVTQRKNSRTSTDRSVKSPERSSPSREPVELNKAGKFGVTLRRTSSTTSAGTPRRTSIPGETQEIEDVTDLSLLEIMMEKAVGYEQRRRIRAQIREVKKVQDDKNNKNVRKKSPVRISPKDQKLAQEPANRSPTEPKKSETRRPSSPAKSYQETVTLEQRSTWRTSKQPEPTIQPVDPTRPASPAKSTRRPSHEGKKPLTNGFHGSSSPERMSPTTLRDTTSPSEPRGAVTNGYLERVDSVRRGSKTETVESTTSVRTQKRVETLVESGVDCITSSYGVGPTDENGRPLFGLRALRRSNTNKQLTDEVLEVKKPEEPQETEPTTVYDTRGRPLFGGLRALRVSEPADDMPEQNSTQLRELVQRHEKVVRETNGPQDQPRQKPKAKLRDSFILQEDDQSNLGHLAEVNNLNRGLSLKSIIQKHENIATNGSVGRSEMESSHTVVTSRTAVSSDGTISHSRDVIKGEVSAKNGEEPVGKVTRTQYTYQSPQGEDKGISKVTTSTTNLGRRPSGPSITEIEDVQDSPPRKSSLKSSLKRSSVTEVSEDVSKTISSRKGSLQKSASEDEEQRRLSSQERETEKSTSRLSSTSQKFTSFNDSGTKSKITSTRQTELRSKTSSPSLKQQKSSEEDSSAEERPRKAVTRGDSVRALQHKFQQATENAANSAPRSQPARAGLILRTSSFTSADSQNKVSSTLKQSTSVSADKKGERQSPDKSRRESTAIDANITRRESSTSDTSSSRRESLSKASSDVASRRESLSKTSSEACSRRESVAKSSSETTSTRVTETSSTSSFLDNRTRVTGVQDILDRMRNADLVNEVGDTDADREARALLNKFLGASVILQGMEQGMRGTNGTGAPHDGTPSSTALVSSVERQRLATTRQKEEDIENIWDEQVLKTLLEQCTDYEGRRKLRARLRTVMAEHKACADLVAITGGSGVDASQLAETETKQTTMRTEGGTVTRTEVHTRTSTNRLTKANSVSSPFAKFRQLERQNSAPSVGQAQATPLFKITDPRVARSASSIKDRLLSWVQAQTRDYKNIQIDNFSTSWNNGLAFCALIHHFCPDAFDYDKLTPDQRRHNFDLAFRVAEEKAGIAPLLDVEDMVVMRRPDWKCVFTYVQSIYRRFHSPPEANRC